MNYIKSLLKKLIELADRVNKEEGYNKIRMYLGFLASYIIHGCSITEYFLYGFYKLNFFSKRTYITSRKQKRVAYWFNSKEKAELFDNKFHFNSFFKDFINREWICTENSNKEDIFNFIKKHKNVIVKPLGSAQGIGIFKVSFESVQSDNKVLEKIVRDKYIIEEIIENHKDIKAINPETLNTIRVLSMVKSDGSVVITNAFLRFGVGDSVVDNFSAGGMACLIDVGSGILKTMAKSKFSSGIIHHPLTKIKLLGYQIEDWDKIVKYISKIALMVPEARYIGWDIAILNNGLELIEGNFVAGITSYQYLQGKGEYNTLRAFR